MITNIDIVELMIFDTLLLYNDQKNLQHALVLHEDLALESLSLCGPLWCSRPSDANTRKVPSCTPFVLSRSKILAHLEHYNSMHGNAKP